MLADEGRAAMSRLRAARPIAASPAKAEPAAAGGSETVTIQAPPGENPTSHFVFRDATDRAQATETKTPLPLDVRRATVEAFRQSLARDKGARQR
jgi:hypothetical protein